MPQTLIPITMISDNSKPVAPLRQGNREMEGVTINRIDGIITIEQESSTSAEYQYFFIRAVEGNAQPVAAGTPIITSGSQQYRDYIPIIFIGQNGDYDDITEPIAQQRVLINHQEHNQDRFIIIGLYTGTAESRAELEAAMTAEYGRQYINLREYMSTEALTDAGLEPIAEDLQNMGGV